MTLRLMGYIARLMQETSARLLSKILRLSQSTILRADKDISKDVEQGIEWLKKAEKNGHELAGQLIREVQQDMEFIQKIFLEAN